MKTDSSVIADLEAERKKMPKETKENNIQKEQLLNELTARGGWTRQEDWQNNKEPLEKA